MQDANVDLLTTYEAPSLYLRSDAVTAALYGRLSSCGCKNRSRTGFLGAQSQPKERIEWNQSCKTISHLISTIVSTEGPDQNYCTELG